MVTPPDITRALAAATADALKAAGINRRDAADLSGIPSTTLHRRLTGRSPLTVTELDTLATLAGTTVAALVQRAERGVPARSARVGTSDRSADQVKGGSSLGAPSNISRTDEVAS